MPQLWQRLLGSVTDSTTKSESLLWYASAFWHRTIGLFGCFGGPYCLHLQGDGIKFKNADVFGRKKVLKKFWPIKGRENCHENSKTLSELLSELKITENICTANHFSDQPSKINIRGMRSRKDTPFPWSPTGSAGSPCTSRPVKTNSSAPEVRPVRPHSPVRHSTRQPSRTSLFYHPSTKVDYTFMRFRLQSGLCRVQPIF